MAYTPIVPTSPILTLVANAKSQFNFSCKNASGSNVDMSTWDGASFTGEFFVPNTNGALPCTLVAPTPVFTGTNGNLLMEISEGDSGEFVAGSWLYQIFGKPTSGDGYQLIASGSISVSPSVI